MIQTGPTNIPSSDHPAGTSHHSTTGGLGNGNLSPTGNSGGITGQQPNGNTQAGAGNLPGNTLGLTMSTGNNVGNLGQVGVGNFEQHNAIDGGAASPGLFLALCLWFIAILIWTESSRFIAWLSESPSKIRQFRNSAIGSIAIIASSVAILIVWYLRAAVTYLPAHIPLGDLLYIDLIYNSKELIAVLLSLSFIPGALAVYNFAIATSVSRISARNQRASLEIRRSPAIAAVGTAFAATNLSASFVTLYLFYVPH